MAKKITPEPWFKEGLRFTCTGCGECCTGAPGYVYLSVRDLSQLAMHMNCSEEEFKKRYTRIVDDQLCLIDAPRSADCIFLKENRCSVYEARPVQCRTFPWWLHNLQSPRNWKDAARRCEGINHPDAPLVSAENIAKQCASYLDNLIEQNFDS
jgi:uncharacterized protein